MAIPSNSDWLTHQWVVAGIVSASSRFIPVPFIDDLVREQCRRFVVSRTLHANEPTENVSLETLRPYYSSSDGCLTGCLGTLAKAPLKIILFPIRKVVAVVTSVRGVPLEIVKMVLLGRTLNRQLRDSPKKINNAYAMRMRMAFEDSFSGMDFRMVKAAMNDALSHVSGWKSSAMETARQAVARQDEAREPINAPKEVETGAQKVQEVLDRPEFADLFTEFDKRFDQRMIV
ncbi:hypothetical protein [Rhodopirellula sallentina]|uniref:Uncharacterized protein n=1 Tax=Rhodopirellula sallentina SM41 TaxID=1263870 RepID=M5UBC9_9BACT|nr:hypothetical protein [Rhodopirellula sallentina]EMI53303.1 hypothetical protein RSSM_05276 [Rhodopirellula sallentina SM41]